ncbi:MAG: acetyl-CoA carboxylase biotin carboxyl carrier protein [Candidatus Methylomirabilales bacterium]
MDTRDIKVLLKLIQDTDIEEIEVERNETRIRIRRRPVATLGPAYSAATPPPVLTGAEHAQEIPSLAPPTEKGITVESPMVGTFYRAPAPGAEPYVKEGSIVEKGTVLCIIEAMKLMNEIEAEIPGKIALILVENAQPVEYGQPLFVLESL